MANNIAIQISANTQQAVAGIQSVNQKLDQMQKATDTASSRFIRISAVVQSGLMIFDRLQAGLQMVASAASACVTAYSAQEIAERRLQTTLRATQNAVGMSAGEMLDLADALSQVSTYSDQEILAVEQMLAATRKISAEVMPEATQAILDMAAATGEDAANAAQRLSQALSDPAGEIESLKEAGIQLSEEQKENIKKVQEQNGVYEAQKILLKEVESTYGGMARAIADTDTGKLQQISDVWQDIKEGLGEGLLHAIGPALDALYEKLLDIDKWIEKHNKQARANEAGFDYMADYVRNGTMPDLRSLSDTELNAILANSRYYRWSSSYDYTMGKPVTAFDMLDKWRAQINAAQRGQDFTTADMEFAIAVQDELLRRRREKITGLTSSLVAPRVGSYQGIDVYAPFRSFQESMYDIGQTFGDIQRATDSLESFLSANGNLSNTYQISQIDGQIAETQSYMDQFSDDADVLQILTEINNALNMQKELLEANSSSTEEWAQAWLKCKDQVMDVVNSSYSFLNSIISWMQQSVDNAADALDELEEKWDDYFDTFNRRQEESRDSLNALLASGNVSYEEYINSMNALDEERAKAEEHRADEEQAARDKANALGRAAFEAERANQIAQATANAALAITNIWASYAASPAIAGVLTGLVSATTGFQIATIAAQEYTPLAAGGIVTSPTRALIGEGGSPEAILPLNESNMDRFGLNPETSAGSITVNISIGTVYSKEDLADEIFRGIERAQRTGALPRWRYA